jgi:hypothetical protein
VQVWRNCEYNVSQQWKVHNPFISIQNKTNFLKSTEQYIFTNNAFTTILNSSTISLFHLRIWLKNFEMHLYCAPRDTLDISIFTSNHTNTSSDWNSWSFRSSINNNRLPFDGTGLQPKINNIKALPSNDLLHSQHNQIHDMISYKPSAQTWVSQDKRRNHHIHTIEFSPAQTHHRINHFSRRNTPSSPSQKPSEYHFIWGQHLTGINHDVRHPSNTDEWASSKNEEVSWMHLGTPTHKFLQYLWNNTDFRWIFKARGDILWPHKVVTDSGGSICKKWIWNPTLENCRNPHIRRRLSSMMVCDPMSKFYCFHGQLSASNVDLAIRSHITPEVLMGDVMIYTSQVLPSNREIQSISKTENINCRWPIWILWVETILQYVSLVNNSSLVKSLDLQSSFAHLILTYIWGQTTECCH